MTIRLGPLTAPLLGFVLVLVVAPPLRAATDLPLKRVMLSTGGVGYFEHETEVDADARLALTVRLDQVDDVLKSIVVYDDKGGVGSISLPGRQPVDQAFRGLPFGRDDLESPVRLLNALQGAVVAVEGARSLQGRVLRVEPETTVLPEGGAVTQHRVTLVTAHGLQQFILEQAESLRFAEAALQAQVDRALAALAAHRVRDRRTLEIELAGEGKRRVRVAYVVETPLWKATYRMVVSDEAAADSARMQGWAVIENMSGGDWRDVELTLVSGNPVTFRQALYTAYYVDRPEVPVEVLGRVLPRPDQGVLAGARQTGRPELEKSRDEAAALRSMELADAAVAEESMAMLAAPAGDPMPTMAQVGAADSAETATQVLFRVPFPVSVAAGNSLVVPIVDREVAARRLSHYQPRAHPRHPLASVDLTNDGDSGLPPGVLTLYERAAAGGATAYIGDARLTTLPVGESRLVSFSVDEKTRIASDAKSTQTVSAGAFSRGVFRLTMMQRQTTTYRLKAPASEPRRVILDHRRQPDWSLVEPAEDEVGLTDDAYRIEVALDAGEERALPVTVERPIVRDMRIASLSRDDFAGYATSDAFDPEVRAAFERLAELRRVLDEADRRVADLERERGDIWNEQGRIRDNLGRVPRDSDLYRRYLKKLDVQEDRLEEIETVLDSASRIRDEARRRLAEFIDRLEI